MPFWDDGFKIPNIESKTMGGKVFWENLAETTEYRLQRNLVFGNCRILNNNDVRVTFGSESEMRIKFEQLTGKIINHAARGDVICVHRLGGIYDHYGVYDNDQCIYEYNLNKSNMKIDIHTVTLEEFTEKSDGYSILHFPEIKGVPDKIDVAALKKSYLGIHFPFLKDDDKLSDLLDMISRLKNSGSEYHLYSPDETIERAKSKLGEHEYNLFFNNCEHYAIWCKTGLSESHQIEGLLSKLKIIMMISTELISLAAATSNEE